MITELLHIKNMTCYCGKVILREKLEELGVEVLSVALGRVKIRYEDEQFSKDDFLPILHHYGFDLIDDADDKVVADIKIAVLELEPNMIRARSGRDEISRRESIKRLSCDS